MRTKTAVLVISGMYLSLLLEPGADAQQSPTDWKVGQEWIVLVRKYGTGTARVASNNPAQTGKTLIPHVQHEFHVKARVMDFVERAGHECVRIRFTGESDAPVINSTNPPTAPSTIDIRNQEYTLTLDAQTWQAIELEGKPEISSNQVNVAGDCRALLVQAWFPVDWIIARSDLKNMAERTELLNSSDFRPRPDYPTPNSALRRTVVPEKDDGARITVGEVSLIPRKSTGEPPKEAMHEVEQVWRPGELWWRSFGRFEGGHIAMEAFLVSDPAGSGKPMELPASHPSVPPNVPAGPTWTVGDEWRFLVKEWSCYPDPPGRLSFEFHMKARVAELVKEEGRDCARIEFIAEHDAPGMYTMLFTLVVDTQTWSPVRFEYSKDPPILRGTTEAQGYRALLPTTPGVPLDWVVLRSDLAGKAARKEFFHFPGLRSVAMFGLRRVVSAPDQDGTVRITVGLWVPRENSAEGGYEPAVDALCEVEQVWQPGELWWRSFRRSSCGRLDLEATRVSKGVQPCQAKGPLFAQTRPRKETGRETWAVQTEAQAITKAREIVGLPEQSPARLSAELIALVEEDNTPFLYDEIIGWPAWHVVITDWKLKLKSASPDEEDRYARVFDVFIDPENGHLLKAISRWPAGVPPIAPEPSARFAEEQMRNSGLEKYVGFPDAPPRVNLLRALDIVLKEGAGSPFEAKQIVAHCVLQRRMRGKARAVWAITLRGIPPFQAAYPGVPVDARNHIRTVVDAETGKCLGSGTSPQPETSAPAADAQRREH